MTEQWHRIEHSIEVISVLIKTFVGVESSTYKNVIIFTKPHCVHGLMEMCPKRLSSEKAGEL